MVELIASDVFKAWIAGLRGNEARARINVRLRRLAMGLTGDVKPVGEGVSELRIDHGPGYRVYFKRRGQLVLLLLCGGDKRTQTADIKQAINIANEWR